LLAGADYLFGQVEVAARLASHVTMELPDELLFDFSEEVLEFGVVDAVFLSSFHLNDRAVALGLDAANRVGLGSF
jgi:hypothetical protein